MLEGGAVAERGTPDQVKAHAGGPVIEVRRHGEPLASIPTDGTAGEVAGIAARFPADAELVVRRPTLDEAFARLTGDHRTELQEAS